MVLSQIFITRNIRIYENQKILDLHLTTVIGVVLIDNSRVEEALSLKEIFSFYIYLVITNISKSDSMNKSRN